MHDNSIDRTTSGSGLVKNLEYKQLQEYYLEDDFGNQTKFKVPEFAAILKWAKKNEVVLTIDIKRSVAVEDVVKAIKKSKAEDVSIIITYDLEQSLKTYKLAPELMQSVSARNSSIYAQRRIACTSGEFHTSGFCIRYPFCDRIALHWGKSEWSHCLARL